MGQLEEAVAQLRANSVTELDLDDNQIGDAGAIALAKALET